MVPAKRDELRRPDLDKGCQQSRISSRSGEAVEEVAARPDFGFQFARCYRKSAKNHSGMCRMAYESRRKIRHLAHTQNPLTRLRYSNTR